MSRWSKPSPVTDPHLGRLERRRGHWRGEFSPADGDPVALAVAGDRRGPAPDALDLARTVGPGLASAWPPAIGRALIDHRANDEDAAVADDPSAVWAEASLEYVAVIPLGGRLTIELGLRVPWDEEHTLGARVCDGELVELNGSVLAP